MENRKNDNKTCAWGPCAVLLWLMVFCHVAIAQQAVTISGSVIDSVTSGALAGVTVEVRGRTTSTKTDQNGAFSIRTELPAILVFTSLGYIEAHIDVTNEQPIYVNLSPTAQNLEEVVVVGYGVQKKTSVTAAVSTLKGDAVAAVPVANLSNTLGGRVAGVIVKQGSGEPGRDGSNIFIRGISSTGATQPLLIVDGIPRDFTQLDPNTVETFTILKDAAAVAPYGVAGANGVVLVTTKRGKSGIPSLSYNGYVGFQNPTVLPDYVDGYQFAMLKNDAARLNGLPEPYLPAELQRFRDKSDPDAYPNEDVFDRIVNKNAILTTHSVEVTGGTERVKYYAGLGYQHQEGMWKTTAHERYNLALNIDAQVTPTTLVSFGVNGRVQNANYPIADRADRGTGRIFELIGFATPDMGPLVFSNGMYGNYVMGSIFGGGYNKINTSVLYTQFSIEQDLGFIEGLKLKGTIAYDPSFSTNKAWTLPIQLAALDRSTEPYQIVEGVFGPAKPSLTQTYSHPRQLTYQASLNYNRTFGNSTINALTLFEAKANDNLSLGAGRVNYNLTIDEISMGSANQSDITNSGISNAARQAGIVYRVAYDYAGKYLLEASGRYDGSYFFSHENRYGFFPAFSVGYRLSEEPFLKKLVWLDELKVRGSYGEVGALAGSPFQYLSTYSVVGLAYVINGSAVQGINERAEPNPLITWERARKTDIGIEARFLKGMINLEADYFYEKRSNMLVVPNVVVPAEYGIGLSQVNAGIMDNRGIELSMSSFFNPSADVRVSLAGNFTYVKNKLLQVFESPVTYDNPNRRQTGRPLGTQFGFRALGYFQEEDFDEQENLRAGIATQPWGRVQPGDIRYEDLDGNGRIDDNDLTAIGDPVASPRIIYGFNPGVQYKGFSLDLLFQGAAKVNWYQHPSTVMPFWNGMHAYTHNLDYWRPDNPNARNPRITSAPTTNNTQVSSFWLADASYLRLKTANISYNIPALFLSKMNVQRSVVYISAQNLFTWTSMLDYDPEIGRNTSYLPDGGWTYPQQTVLSIGLNITF